MLYKGKIKKYKKNIEYKIDYEMEGSDEESYNFKKYAIAADFIVGDLYVEGKYLYYINIVFKINKLLTF